MTSEELTMGSLLGKYATPVTCRYTSTQSWQEKKDFTNLLMECSERKNQVLVSGS